MLARDRTAVVHALGGGHEDRLDLGRAREDGLDLRFARVDGREHGAAHASVEAGLAGRRAAVAEARDGGAAA